MIWEDFRVGDVVECDKDLLLVVHTNATQIHLLGLDITSELNDAGPGVVEVWDLDEEGWPLVVKNTKLVH